MSKQLLKAAFTLFMALMAGTTIGQNAEADARLAAKFSQTDIKKMTQDEVAYWNFFVNEGYVVFEIKKEKGESEMEAIAYEGEPSEVAPLALGLSPKETEVQTYRLGNTGYGLMILSEQKLRAKIERLNK